MRGDGSCFNDHTVHNVLKKKGIPQLNRNEVSNDRNEWFKCTLDDVQAAILSIQTNTENTESRTQNFSMRPEQERAVEKTIKYFKSTKKESTKRSPRFLWNAKMRFGKTFATYQLVKKMSFRRVLVLTFKPAVQSAWREDLLTHMDFEGWQFIGFQKGGKSIELQYQEADTSLPIVCFGSFQDFLGVNKETGGIKTKNEFVHTTNWDLVVFDEYHYGAWKDNAQKLFDQDEDVYDEDLLKYDKGNAYNEDWLPITSDHYLYLSGTPFRALNSGEFIEEQIYSWTYSDEQRAKETWQGDDNPYAALPRMLLLTYKLPESIQSIAKQGEFNEFDLNVFFRATGTGKDATFVYKDYVQKWLNLIRGSYLETTVDELKLGARKPPMPYSDTRLLNVLSHTLWFLPNVASCFAMKNLLEQKQNLFYHDYKINICAGPQAGIGEDALLPVISSMEEPLCSKTITLSCGKLTTGVTIRPWTGIFMLRNLSTPETYFQAAFRVQSPWEIIKDNGEKEIIKHECYVFDFALNRALRQISDYSRGLNIEEQNPEKKVEEFISFLPVLAYDGSTMRQINASEILDISMAGTTATLLAKRWESALLVNVDNETLSKLLANEAAMDALMRIEGFRTLNADIELIINKSNEVKAAKRTERKLTRGEKKEISDAEKEYKKKRKEIQEKLIKFATRIPIFMYLTDYREYCLKDVITKLEPDLFKKVTGLEVKDFDLLVSLNVFNESLMNDAVYKFKRYEDASLSYTGIDKHSAEPVGLYNTTISRKHYNEISGCQPISQKVETVLGGEKSKSIENTMVEQKLMAAEPMTKYHYKKNAPLEHRFDRRDDVTETSRTLPKKIEISKISEGSSVFHRDLGEGIVKKVARSFVTVEFNREERVFQFPESFLRGFLRLKNDG